MSIAWSGIVLLVLLLPGFLFFIGLYFPEKFTREVVERSPLGQLAGTVLIAFVVHGLLLIANGWLCGSLLPCINLHEVLAAIALDTSKTPLAVAEVAATLSADRCWIFAYVIMASAGGLLLGWGTGSLVVSGALRVLVQHRWVYDLKVEDGDVLTVAYVLSRVQHGQRHVLYRGFLKAFGLQKDGRFSYLILTGVVRYYLNLEDAKPVTSHPEDWIVIGEAIDGDRHLPPGSRPGRRRDRSYFVIDGADIANVIFDRYAFPFGSAANLDAIIAAAEQAKAASDQAAVEDDLSTDVVRRGES